MKALIELSTKSYFTLQSITTPINLVFNRILYNFTPKHFKFIAAAKILKNIENIYSDMFAKLLIISYR